MKQNKIDKITIGQSRSINKNVTSFNIMASLLKSRL